VSLTGELTYGPDAPVGPEGFVPLSPGYGGETHIDKNGNFETLVYSPYIVNPNERIQHLHQPAIPENKLP